MPTFSEQTKIYHQVRKLVKTSSSSLTSSRHPGTQRERGRGGGEWGEGGGVKITTYWSANKGVQSMRVLQKNNKKLPHLTIFDWVCHHNCLMSKKRQGCGKSGTVQWFSYLFIKHVDTSGQLMTFQKRKVSASNATDRLYLSWCIALCLYVLVPAKAWSADAAQDGCLCLTTQKTASIPVHVALHQHHSGHGLDSDIRYPLSIAWAMWSKGDG